MRASWKLACLPLLAAIATGATGCRGGQRRGDGAGAEGRGACKVLLLIDDTPSGAAPLAMALTAAGLHVTTSTATSTDYAGRPSLADYRAVVVLAGGPLRAPPSDMPPEGQKALVDFVGAGHGVVLTEWAAFHVAGQPTPRWQILKPLVLLGRSGAHSGQVTYEVDPAQGGHPVWAGLPPSFSFTSTSNVGTALPGAGVTRLATSAQAGDAVVVRDAAPGRVVHLAHAGNHVPHGWSNVHLQTLVANAARWAGRCE